MQAQPTPEHEWLKQFIGEWTFKSECPPSPDGEVMKAEGKESVRMLGDLWALGETTGAMPGGGMMTAIITIGFDPEKKKFVGTWVGSPMASMFNYEGTLDDAKRVLTLNTTGAHCEDPTREADYQDVMEFLDDGTREMRSRMKNDDGEWVDIMKAVYTRVK